MRRAGLAAALAVLAIAAALWLLAPPPEPALREPAGRDEAPPAPARAHTPDPPPPPVPGPPAPDEPTPFIEDEPPAPADPDPAPAGLGGLTLRVLDLEGREVAESRVLLHVNREVRRFDGEPPHHWTDLRAGTIRGDVSAPGFRAASFAAEVTAGATTEHEVRLDRGLTLAGTLVDDTGTPIAGAGVLAIGGDPTRRGNHGQALTDPDGRFLIGGLEDRTYDLQSDPDGCDRVGLSEVVPPMAGLVLTAPRRGTVTAFLRLPAGFPTPESVTLFRPASRGSDEMHASSRSWNGGRFEHGNIPTGTVRLRFFVDGLAPAVRELQVTPGERTDLGEIPLDAGLVLEGRIVDRHGRPVARALVSSGVTRDASWRSAVTQADGSFRLERLVAGAVDLHVEADDHLPARIPVTVPLEPPQLVVRLRVAGRLAGEVRNADGSAAARRAVQLHQGKRHVRQLETDEHGRFQAAVPEGSYRVIVPSLWSYGSAGFARPEPGDAAEGEVHVKEAEESKLVLTLSPR